MITTSPPVSAAALPVRAASPAIRLDYLDGLRGVAAFYVLLHHIYLQTFFWNAEEHRWVPQFESKATSWLRFGHFAVAIFIVLSGYCLMLPIARSAEGRLRGGFRDYIKRRSRRILPPYYAALILSLLLYYTVDGLSMWSVSTVWRSNICLDPFARDTVISHFLLIHNFKASWIYKINHPMWSVATEWQIYFIFPALLLPVWRRFGNMAVILTAFAAGLVPHYFGKFDTACPWFLGLFALGMGGAACNFSGRPALLRWRDKMPWAALGAGLLLLFVGMGIAWPNLLEDSPNLWVMDTLLGAAAVCLIVRCTRYLTANDGARKPLALRVFGARPLVFLGGFSYSLYLTHAMTLAILHLHIRSLPIPPVTALRLMLGWGIFLSLAASYLFYIVFERPFVSAHKPVSPASTAPADNGR